jgi:hypothetical protein
MKNPGVYQASTSNLSVELQSQLIDVMKLAEQKEAEVGPIQIYRIYDEAMWIYGLLHTL